MKASKLIEELEKAIDKHGDMDVIYSDPEWIPWSIIVERVNVVEKDENLVPRAIHLSR